MKFSKTEIIDLTKAWIAISIAFGIVLNEDNFLFSFLLAGITVGVGFLLHELGHKLVAQRFGYWAEFQSFDHMLVLAIAMSFFGFVFAAPGAVMFHGSKYRKDEVGKIGVAGPVVNLVLALVFLFIPGALGEYGFMINSWLALFNMIPVSMFDGAKIWQWNKIIYFVVTGIAFILVFFVSY